MTIILLNQTANVIVINDLGLTFDANQILTVNQPATDIAASETLLTAIANQTLALVSDNTVSPPILYTLTDSIKIISGISGGSIPVSIPDILKPNENTIYVHNTHRPIISGLNFLATWAGADDDVTNHITGNGTGFNITTSVDTPVSTLDVMFDSTLGDVYLQQAFIGYANAGLGDAIKASVIANATTMIEVPGAYSITNNMVTYVGGTNGSYTLGGVPNLIPSYLSTGAWDYNGTSLTPNETNTGAYNISNIEQEVYKILNNFQIYGTTGTPLCIIGEDTHEIPNGYFVRVSAINNSNTVWQTWFNIALFRQQP